ncbi:MAG: PqqD family protein [Euryarchaeota archaeon]|nr:PqqD family protein [Euryarchaeota archaeon]
MPSRSSASGKVRKGGPNLLDLVPVRSPDYRFNIRKLPSRQAKHHQPGAAGTVSISVPRFSGRLGRGFCRLARIRPEFDLNLDSYGSFVWLLIDGKTTVRKLGALLREEYGETVEPLYGRLAHFLSLLERNRLISYLNLEAAGKRAGARRKNTAGPPDRSPEPRR